MQTDKNLKALNPTAMIAPVVSAIFLLGGALLGLVVPPVYAWGGLLAVLLGCSLIGRPAAALLAVFIWWMFQPIIMSYSNNILTQYMDEFSFLLFAGVLMFSSVWRRERRLQKIEITWMKRAIVVLVATILFSLLFTGVELRRLTHFIKSYMMFPLIFSFALQYLRPERVVKNLVIFIFGYFLFQLALNMGWLLRVNPIRNLRWSPSDFSIGTLGACNMVAYFSIMLFYFCYAGINQSKNQKIRVLSMLFMPILLFQIFITYTAHAYVLLAVGVAQFYLLFFKNIKNKALPVIIAIFVIAAFALFEVNANFSKSGSTFSVNFVESGGLKRRWESIIEGPKGAFYKDAFWRIPNEQAHRWLIGTGPGQYMTAPALMKPSEVTFKYLGDWYFTFSGQEQLRAGSMITNPINGFCALFGELGIAGFCAYLFLFIFPVVHVYRNCQNERYSDVLQRCLAQSFVPAMTMFLFLAALYDAWDDMFFIIFLWVWAALVWEPIKFDDQGSAPGEQGLSPTTQQRTTNNRTPVNRWARQGAARR
jgi:hypothetical protein